jgi:hypothetical protein
MQRSYCVDLWNKWKQAEDKLTVFLTIYTNYFPNVQQVMETCCLDATLHNSSTKLLNRFRQHFVVMVRNLLYSINLVLVRICLTYPQICKQTK